MQARHFNNYENKRARSNIMTNPLEAKAQYEEYIKKYPYDASAYPQYCYVLIILGELQEAEKILNDTQLMIDRDIKIYKTKQSSFDLDRIYFDIYLNKLRISLAKGNYQDALELLQLDKYNINSRGLMTYYCKRQLGLLDTESKQRNMDSYLFNQVIEYRKEDFIDHINHHQADYNMNLDEPDNYIFAFDFPIDSIIQECEKYVPSDKKLLMDLLNDRYYFKYDGCGRVDNKLTDYFCIVCFHNTGDMITMYPQNYGENLPYIDLNHMKPEEPQEPKTKRLSQIDKFNQKYGIK